MLVLDTDLLSVVQRRSGEAYRILVNRLNAISGHEVISVSIVSFEEQTRGWLAQIARAKTRELKLNAYQRLLILLRDYCTREILAFNEQTMIRFEELQTQKIRIGTMDLKIGAIALANNAKLISRNLKDFRKIPGLIVEDWTKPT